MGYVTDSPSGKVRGSRFKLQQKILICIRCKNLKKNTKGGEFLKIWSLKNK